MSPHRLSGWLGGRGGGSLSTRIAALSVLLLLAVQLAGFSAIRASIDRVARAQLATELARGEEVWRDMLKHQAEQIDLAGRMAAKDFGFQTTLFQGTPDEDTVTSAMDSLVERVGADLSAFVAADGRVRGVVSADVPPAQVGVLAASLAAGTGQRGVHLLDGHPYHVVSTQLLPRDPKGWLVFGYAIDRPLLQRLGQLAGMDVAVRVPAPGQPRVVLSTLHPEAEAALGQAADGPSVVLQGEAMQTRSLPLGEAEVLLLRSFSQAVAPYRELQWTLLLITLAGVAVFAAGSVVAARRVTTPLRSLVQASERLRGGAYDEPMRNQDRHDEVGGLAQALDHMRLGIAEREERLREAAFVDRLTRLPNRAAFREQVQAAIDAGQGGRFAVVILNLNRFKPVNDALGYQLGDQLLREVAKRLGERCKRGGDLVARLGGDEFALLLPGVDEPRGRDVAARIAGEFTRPHVLQEQTVDLSAAFGIACWPSQGAEADTLISRAEIAMHEAKRRTEAVLVYDTRMDPDSAATLSLLSELRQAVDRHELRLFLQPKFALASGRLVGAEALVRWQHPTRGMVPPLAFIPFAEKTGFVRELTDWIFEDVARQWTALQASGLRSVSVNLSARDLMDLELPARLDRILGRTGAPPEAFCLEITETAIMDDPLRAQQVLRALKGRGFKLSIDDFGEGYTSLRHLRHLPVDELKVDGIFVKRMDCEPEDEKIVRAVVDLAHNLGLSVVAEGVENEAAWQQLQAMRCDEAQGFHMCRPLPAAELPEFARRWAARKVTTAAEAAPA